MRWELPAESAGSAAPPIDFTRSRAKASGTHLSHADAHTPAVTTHLTSSRDRRGLRRGKSARELFGCMAEFVSRAAHGSFEGVYGRGRMGLRAVEQINARAMYCQQFGRVACLEVRFDASAGWLMCVLSERSRERNPWLFERKAPSSSSRWTRGSMEYARACVCGSCQ